MFSKVLFCLVLRIEPRALHMPHKYFMKLYTQALKNILWEPTMYITGSVQATNDSSDPEAGI